MTFSIRYLIIILFILLTLIFSNSVVCQTSGIDNQFIASIHEDLFYYTGKDADQEKHKLNLFLPKNVEFPPIILWIHGGAWAFGDRKNETNLALQFAKSGIAVATISYRLSPGIWKDPKHQTGVQHPEHIKDVAKAFRWLHKNADKYGYDRNSIFVSGYSAGGHLAALLASDPIYLNQVGLSVKDIRGAIPIAGAYDIAQYYHTHLEHNGKKMADEHVLAVFGESIFDLKDASPTEYASFSWVPILVISETDSYKYTALYEEKVKSQRNNKIEFHHIQDKNHTELAVDLSENPTSECRNLIENFIKKHRPKYEYLDRGDFNLAYRIFGNGTPLFLINDGPGYSSHHLETLAIQLSNQYQVIIFDQRGTGFSYIHNANAINITMNKMVSDLEALREHLAIERFILMGHSFGGIYAMKYAIEHQKRIKQLILSHTGGATLNYLNHLQYRLRSRLNDDEIDALQNLTYIDGEDYQNFETAKVIAAGYVYDRKQKDLIFNLLAYQQRIYSKINQLVWTDLHQSNYNITERLKHFHKPTLILHGNSDINHPNAAIHLKDILSNAKLKLIKRCVHYGWIEQPTIYFKTLYDFLEND